MVCPSLRYRCGEAVGLHTALDLLSNQQFDNVDFVLDCKRLLIVSILV